MEFGFVVRVCQLLQEIFLVFQYIYAEHLPAALLCLLFISLYFIAIEKSRFRAVAILGLLWDIYNSYYLHVLHLYYDSTSNDIHCLDRRTRVCLATLSTIQLNNLSCISKLTEQLSLIFTFNATIIKFASRVVWR